MSELSPQYIDHFTHPRGVGEVENPSGVGEVQHEGGGCFDRIRLTIAVKGDLIEAVRFKARACSGTIAACSALVEWAQGRRVKEVKEMTPEVLVEKLGGIPETKRHSVELAVKAIKKALPLMEESSGE